MKLVSFIARGVQQMGFVDREKVYSLHELDEQMPLTMDSFLENWDENLPYAQALEKRVANDGSFAWMGYELVQYLAPVPNPGSLRDGYAFRQHVAAARRNRKVPMIPEFDAYPVLYFSNHRSVRGPGEIVCLPDHLEQLDFELEAAIVICRQGRDILAADADSYIGGLMIMNDISARRLQMEEMLLNLGPAKGKDFATTIGPWLVTVDELHAFEMPPPENHSGKRWNLEMTASINGAEVSRGNLADMDWTFAELIERASYGVDLYPGDIIGSGTVGTGCLLELNGTGRFNNPHYPEQWLQAGDEIVLSVQGLGNLENTIVASDSRHSILQLRKNIKP